MGLLDNLNFSQPFSLSSLLPSEAQLQAYKQKSDAEAVAQFGQDPNPVRRVPFNLLTALGVNPTLAKAAPTTIDNAPFTGDASLLADAGIAALKGDWKTGLPMGLLAALPFVPASKVKGLLKQTDDAKQGVSISSGQTLYRYERPNYSGSSEGAIFYTPDKSYAELYKGEDSVLKTAQTPENFLDIRLKKDREKVKPFLENEYKRLKNKSDNYEIDRIRSELNLMKQNMDRNDAQGVSGALANLDLIYMTEEGLSKLPVGMSEKRLMDNLGVDAMTIKEFGRDVDEYSVGFREIPKEKAPNEGLLAKNQETKPLLNVDTAPKQGIQTILREKYPTADLDIFEMDRGIELSKIALPEGQRSQGLGSKIMDDLIAYADANNLKVATTPDTTFGGSSKKRLEDFYKNFGFKFNKNRNKDFDFKNSMIRQPTLSDSQKAEKASLLRAEANAQRFGEDVDTSYRVQHQAKGYDDGDPIRLDNLTKSIDGGEAGYPDDFYTPKGRMLYAPPARFPDDEYGIANTQSYDAILKAKGNPAAEVTIYRAVPNEENITKINEGDFVTLSPKYAELHGASGYGSRGEDAGKILSQKVKVKDLLWDGNDVNEFGFFPKK